MVESNLSYDVSNFLKICCVSEVDFAGSSPEFAADKEHKQISTEMTRIFLQASKEKGKLSLKMMGNSRVELALLTPKLEATVPQASVLQVCHSGNMPSFHSTEPIGRTEY